MPELAQRKPENLLAKMAQVNEEKKLVRRVPTESKWQPGCRRAELPRVVTY